MISVISPIYNESGNLMELYSRVVRAFNGIREEFEFILVENGSTDHSLEIIKELRKKDPRVKFLSLSRNFGHQGAIVAGLNHAVGDAVISLDGDLQHPPELIPEFIKLWKEGYDVVYTTKKKYDDKKIFNLSFNKLFYRLISLISDVKLNYGQSDYRLIDRKVLNVILNIPEKNKFLRGIVEWVGFKQTSIEYDVESRKSGKSKFSFYNYMSFALDGIFSFSNAPLRIFLWVGLLVALFCVCYAVLYFVMGLINLIRPDTMLLPSGSATITVSVLFLGAVQLIGIGCLGEYIGRIYSQVKERPDFIVKEKDV